MSRSKAPTRRPVMPAWSRQSTLQGLQCRAKGRYARVRIDRSSGWRKVKQSMAVAPDRPAAIRTGEIRWRLRIRTGVHEEDITQSRSLLSWCDELAGVRFACPRCGRMKAVLRRWRPIGCQTIYWLLCLSVVDRRSNVMSVEVFRELLTETLGPDEASHALRTATGPPG